MTHTIIKYWTYEIDGEIFDCDFDTQEQADIHAQDEYADNCQEQSPQNNQKFECDAYVLIEFSYNEDGDRIFHQRVDNVVLEYTHYHGDYDEHFNQGNYI